MLSQPIASHLPAAAQISEEEAVDWQHSSDETKRIVEHFNRVGGAGGLHQFLERRSERPKDDASLHRIGQMAYIGIGHLALPEHPAVSYCLFINLFLED